MNKIRNRKNNKGFSLVELIIVIAIMVILAGILIPQFVKYISSSKVSADIQQAENIYNAVAAQYADDGSKTTGKVVDTTGDLIKIDATVAGSLNIGNSAPVSKVDSTLSFYYSCDSDGNVAVYLSDASRTAGAYAAATDTKLSPSIDGKDASKWKK